MKTIALLFLAAMLAPLAHGQNTVKVKVRAALYDRDLNLKPVPQLAIEFIPAPPSSALPIAVQTNFDGVAEAELPAGKYRALTEKPIELFDKSYVWDLEAEFSHPENVLELSNTNAKTTPITGGREARVDELASQFKRVKEQVVTVWTDRGALDGFVVDPSGLVITTQAQVERATWIAVQFDDHRRLGAVIAASDKEHDFAVLRINPSEAGTIVPVQMSSDPGALIEGERVFIIENPGKDSNKKLTTGVISRADEKEIVSDVKLNFPGAPLFNSSGSVVGLVQISDKEFHLRPIVLAKAVLADAKQKIAASTPPPSHLLPTLPTDNFPQDSLRAPGRGSWEKDFYSFKAGDFTVELIDPIASYESDTDRYQRAMKDYSKHPKGKTEPTEPEHKYQPVLAIFAVPQVKTSWGETMLAGMAAGPYSTAPTYKHYKNGFKKMRVLCGEKEVEPIWPGRFIAGARYDYSVVLKDEAFSGQYFYAHDAISPQCGKVTLQLFSTSDPDHPIEKIVDDKIVARIWSDFEPYRKTQEAAGARGQK